jgi:HK97 family phage portal protein
MSRILDAVGRLLSGRSANDPARPADAKASAVGPLIAWEPLGQPVWAPRDYAGFAREGFMQNAIVYRSVRMVAEAAASVPLLLYEGETELDAHPLLDLIARPAPDQTGADFLESWYGFLLVSGNAYVEAVGLSGTLRELHVLRPDRMKVVPGADGWPEAFEYSASGRSVRFEAEPVAGVRPILHVRLFHPVNDHYGMSPIEAAANAIDIHNAAGAWNKALLDNAARPSGALVYATASGNMTGEQYQRLKSELEEGFQGAKNAGRPLLLEGGLDWKPLSLSPKEMDFVEAKHAAAREIALALGVPPMLLGIPGDNTYTDDPYDPGGPTNLGITLQVFARWKGVALDGGTRERVKAELKSIPEATARAIYRARYWTPAQCELLAAPLAFFHFDAAVNHGVSGATRLLQQAVGTDVDGEIGPLTMAAIARMPVTAVLDAYADARRERYRSLPHFWRFGRGWLARVDTALGRARQRIEAHAIGAAPVSAQAKEGSSDMAANAKTETNKWWGQSVTIWGAIITGLATVLPALGPVIGVDITGDLVQEAGENIVQTVQGVGGLIGIAMTIFGRVRASTALIRRDVSVKL